MLRDLLPTPATTLRWVARHTAIAVSVMFALGMAGIGTGRTVESHQAKTDNQQVQPILASATIAPAVSAATELMHDAPAIDATPKQARPSLAVQTLMSKRHSRIMMMQVTAYCPCKKCCGPDTIGITASGKHISYNSGRFVAADTTVLPFGTKILVPGYGERPVEVIDRGGAIRGNHLDVFFPTHEEALKWGRQTIAVTVIE
jgi:3D (Asp-Asp-Asp) domain-containing protein